MTSIDAQHLLIDLVGVDEAACLDAGLWINAFTGAAQALGLQVLTTNSHVFGAPAPPGMTAFVLLDASHCSVHTYSDLGIAAVDIFVCTSKDLDYAWNLVKESLGGHTYTVTQVQCVPRFTDMRTPQ